MEEIRQKLSSACPAVQESAAGRLRERAASAEAAEAAEAKVGALMREFCYQGNFTTCSNSPDQNCFP